MRSLFSALLLFLPASLVADPVAFLDQHCVECHDAEVKKGGLDLTALETQFADAKTFATWVKVHDAIARGEMPPKKKARPDAGAAAEVVRWLDQELTIADEARLAERGRIRLRRMTRSEFQNTLQDLLALPRLDLLAMLPSDGRIGGYEKIAGALDAAIAKQSQPPRVFQRRIYPAGLFKFGGNLVQGQFVLLKDKQPDPALPVRGGFEDKTGHVGDAGPDLEERKTQLAALVAAKSESAVGLLNPNLAGYEAAMNVSPIYPGLYRMKLSLWGFHWNQGKPEP